MIDFPSSPTVGQQYSSSGKAWEWTGVAWKIIPIADAKVAAAAQSADDAAQSAEEAAQSAADAAESAGAAEAAAETFTEHVNDTTNPHSVTKAQVGLGNVDNTSDANKPISTATQTALNAKAPIASPTFTGTVSGITKSMVGLGNVDNTSDANKPISTATQTALDGKVPTTRTVAGKALSSDITLAKADVGLGNVDNTSDANKPVSTATQTAVNGVKTTIEPNNQSGTSYTLVLADAGKRVAMSNGSSNTVTVPPNGSVAFPVNTTLFVSQDGTGATTIAAGSGVTINTADGLKVGGQYRMVSLIKTATNTWLLVGGVS